MKKSKRSEYANYLVLSDKSNNKLGSSFERFLNFKKVKEVLNNISECTWTTNTEKIFLISNQLGILI